MCLQSGSKRAAASSLSMHNVLVKNRKAKRSCNTASRAWQQSHQKRPHRVCMVACGNTKSGAARPLEACNTCCNVTSRAWQQVHLKHAQCVCKVHSSIKSVAASSFSIYIYRKACSTCLQRGIKSMAASLLDGRLGLSGPLNQRAL